MSGRGGYGGRGRGGHNNSYNSHQNQMSYSPGPSFRPPPSQPRGAHSMPQPFNPQARPMGYPNSPNQAARSPAFANAHPATPQMATQQMQGQYNAYPHMNQQHVNTRSFSSVPLRDPALEPLDPRKRFHGTNWRSRHKSSNFQENRSGSNFPGRHFSPFATSLLPHHFIAGDPNFKPNLSPESPDFENILTLNKLQAAAYYDPNYYQYQNAYMQGMPYGMPPQQQMPPSSPRPPFVPNQSQPYMPQNPYPQQHPGVSMSRTSSQVSTSERPTSSTGQPAAPGHAHSGSRATNSPAPAASSFVKPPKKSGAIIIKDPSTGSVKNFEKPPASPARVTPSPVKGAPPASTATPPPRAPSSEPTKVENKAPEKTDEEKKKEMQDAVARKIEQDKLEEQKKKDEAAQKATQEAERKQQEEKAAADAKKAEEEKEKLAKEAEAKAKEDEEKAAKAKAEEEAAAKAKADAEASKPNDDDEIDFDALEAEMKAQEEEEARREAAYQAKKQAAKEEAERKKKEEEEAYMANLQNLEREAEARELEREKKRNEGGVESVQDALASLKLKDGSSTPAAGSPAPKTESGAATPVSDVSMAPPTKVAGKTKPAALKLETAKSIEPPQPSAAMKSLQTARFLEDPSKVSYPPSVVSPNPALHARASTDRKFKYDKEFLLQFQPIFKEKPTLDWDMKIQDTIASGPLDPARSGSRTPMSTGGRQPSNRPPVPFKMGQFGGMPPSTSQDRFAASTANLQGSRGPGPMGVNPFGSFSRGGMGMAPSGSRGGSVGMPGGPRSGGSTRGGTRTGSKNPKNNKKEEEANKSMPLTQGMDLKPLLPSSTGWKPRSIGQGASPAAGPAPGGEELMAPDVVQRKVKSNLNKMTPEKFDKISDQILDIVAQSKHESDGRTLRQVIQLTFEKATDEAHWAPMYAKFCKRMLESMNPDIKDENIRDKNGQVVTGGALFRKYLLNRCQEEFERGWKVNLPPKPEGQTEEAAMLSDEYYIAAAAKRRGLGLVKFIGELFKLSMLTERIMHECVKKLVDYEGVPDEAEVESLTSLLKTIGYSLDNSERLGGQQGRSLMDAYFQRIDNMMKNDALPSRLHFMLLVSSSVSTLVQLFFNTYLGYRRPSQGWLEIEGSGQGSQDHYSDP